MAIIARTSEPDAPASERLWACHGWHVMPSGYTVLQRGQCVTVGAAEPQRIRNPGWLLYGTLQKQRRKKKAKLWKLLEALRVVGRMRT